MAATSSSRIVPSTSDNLLRGRRSARHYSLAAVPDSLVREILDLARFAPSSMDGQPWSFVVVRNVQTLRALAQTKDEHCSPVKKDAYPAGFITSAPVLIAVCVDRDLSNSRERENGILAACYILLAAEARGLGGVFMTAYQPDSPGLSASISDILQLPDALEPIALLPLGYPDRTPPFKDMRPLADITYKERYGEPWLNE